MQKQNILKKLPPWAGWLIGYGFAIAAAVGFVYYWRVAYSLPAEFPALKFTLGVAGIFSILYAALFLTVRFIKTESGRGAALVFLLGLLFVFANAPLQAPDEVDHFKRAYSISMGRLDFDGQRGYPADVDLLVQSFPGGYNHKLRYQPDQPMIISSFKTYFEGMNSGHSAPQQKEPSVFGLVRFFPQALAMAAGRLFGLGALGMMYAGRIGNLAAYALLCLFIFKNCDKYRGVFIAFAALPLSLFMAASNSYDVLMLACSFLAVSYFCKNKIYNLDIIAFGLAVTYACYIKPNNIVLVAVLLLIPKARWKNNVNPWVAAGIILLAGLGVYWLSGKLATGPLMHNVDLSQIHRGVGEGESLASPTGQLKMMVSNPIRFIAVALLTFVENGAFIFGGSQPGLGTFGTLDLTIPLAAVLSVLSVCSASALGIQQKDDTKTSGAAGLFLASLLYGGAVMAALYILHTDVGSIRITGLQPRYFLPAFLMLFMLAGIMLGKAVQLRLSVGSEGLKRTESITLWIAAAAAFISVVLLFEANFIGQWMAKPEGGFKLVNMFGWVQ